MMANERSVYTVLEKTGKRSQWKEGEIGWISGNITGDRRVHVQPPDRDSKATGPRLLIVDGKLDESRVAALVGHHSFSLTLSRHDRLPFKVD